MQSDGMTPLPQRVLVTGASGFVGRAVVAALRARGISVVAAGRSAPTVSADATVTVGDYASRTDWRAALTGVDAVVHLAARTHTADLRDAGAARAFIETNVGGTVQLATQAMAAGVRRFVFMSSIKVNGEARLGPPAGVPRYAGNATPAPRDHYGRSKWQAEQRLLALADSGALALTILRPPLIYGPHQRGNLRWLLDWIARGRPLPFASVVNARSLIYVHNLADAVVAALAGEPPCSRIFTLADVDIATPDLVRALADALGVRARVWPCPPSLLVAAAQLVRRADLAERLLGSLLVDSTAAHRELGWQPRVDFTAAVAATAAWYRSDAG